MNALQIFPNLAGVIGLSGIVAAIARQRVGAPAPAVEPPGPSPSRR